jgi:hypothetical protein
MYRLMVDFCESCNQFKEVSRVGGSFQCFDCKKTGIPIKPDTPQPLVEPRPKSGNTVKPKQVAIRKPRSIYPSNRKREVGTGRRPGDLRKVNRDKFVLKLFEPEKVYTRDDLWQIAVSRKFFQHNAFCAALRSLQKQGLIYGREIYENGIKIYKIYSVSANINDCLNIETREKVLTFITDNADTEPVCTNTILEFLNQKRKCCSCKNLHTIIKTRLLEEIMVYRVHNKQFYVLKNNQNQLETLLSKYPKAIFKR